MQLLRLSVTSQQVSRFRCFFRGAKPSRVARPRRSSQFLEFFGTDALTVLNKRDRRTFETRRLAEEQITLVELAEEFGVSRERVRQIEVSAFEKVQNAVKQRVAAGAPSGQMWV